jgi:Carboxypeptidase regulatory-like domain/TonB dependent receptor
MMTQKLLGMVLCVFLSVVAFGQNATTSVRGIITDPTGAVVQGATVTLTNTTTQISQEQKVGKSGEYSFVDLQPATYTISVAFSGFGTQTKDTELLVSQPATINFKLIVGSAAQTVEVSAASTLNFSDATIGNAIDSAQIQTMPIDSRNVADLLSLQPGVLYFGNNNSASNPAATQDSRLGAVAGARSDQGNITLDGLDDNDQTFGYAFTGVLRSTLDSTQEYRVTTANANADTGRSSGAQITLVTKSGTNHFHGSAYEYYRNRYFAANDWFTKQAQVKSGQPNKPGQLTRNTFGGTIGGPVLKDKLFFFFNYEGQRTRESSTVTQEVPTALYRTGTLQYKDNSSPSVVRTLTPAQVATLDAPCTANGVCPSGPGPNPAILAYFAQLPVANGLTIGDGLNEGSFAFSSPTPYSHNTSIIKFDWTPSSAQHVFIRGNLQKDVVASTQQFPGLPPSTTTEDNTKGMAAGDTWVINSGLVNDIRYGYTRQGSAAAGVGTGNYTDIRFIASPTAETRTTIRSVPVNSILDTLNYTRGAHSIQVGGTWRLIHNNTQTNANSFNSGNTNPLGLSTKNLPNPTSLGYTPIANSFNTSYLEAYANLVGTTPVLTQNINYAVNPGGTTGSLLAQGAYITRNFIANEFEVYAQDSWRATPKLTFTYGLRYSNLQVPYDKNGQSAAPTIDTHAFFEQRAIAAAAGQVYEPPLAFAPNGPVYGRPGYWAKQKDNFAPRFAVAYALDPKTSIRAGAGMYYDNFGQGIVNAFNSFGSFGLASQISSALGNLTTENSPRFINRTTLPNLPGTTPAATQTFPYVLPQTLAAGSSFGISWGVDNKIKTPYSEVFNLSVQRSLPWGFTFEAAYVGHFGRKLMQQLDLATPVNLADQKSGATYFQAGAQLAAVVDQNAGNATATVAPIPYFENLFPQLASVSNTKCPNPSHTSTQAIYCNEFVPNRGGLGETTALADLDFYCVYGCPANAPTNRFFQGQFSSLYAWSSIGTSSYNAGQFVLRHPLSHGFQGDLSYSYGNSMDLGSDAERSSEKEGGSGSYITNAWDPAQSRGVSDFDTRHLITANGSYLLPFGRGQAFGTHVGRLTDLAIGGWQVASIVRWTSGLPFSLTEGGFTTDWEISSYGVKTGNFKAKKVYNPGNIPNAFGTALANQITGSVATGSPLERLPYPGEAGERNNLRRDGYFGADASLTKPFKITESQLLRFSWEVFNLSNSVRFNTVSSNLTSGTFGNYSTTLTTSRRMQFSLRYSF